MLCNKIRRTRPPTANAMASFKKLARPTSEDNGIGGTPEVKSRCAEEQSVAVCIMSGPKEANVRPPKGRGSEGGHIPPPPAKPETASPPNGTKSQNPSPHDTTTGTRPPTHQPLQRRRRTKTDHNCPHRRQRCCYDDLAHPAKASPPPPPTTSSTAYPNKKYRTQTTDDHRPSTGKQGQSAQLRQPRAPAVLVGSSLRAAFRTPWYPRSDDREEGLPSVASDAM
jgi:hypothetical protein